MPTARAIPRPGLVSLDLRTHKEHVFPLGDLAALSPEGRRVAEARNPDNKQCLLYVHRLDGSHRRVLVRTIFPVCPGDPRWSPDGRTIAYSLFTKCAVGAPGCHPVQLWLVRTSGGAPSLLSNDAGTAAWAPASKRLAFPGELDGAGRSRLTVENRDGSARVAFGSRHEIYSVSWSGDGRKVLYSTNTPSFQNGGTGEIHAVSVATGTDSVVASGVDPAWSRGGRFLSFVRRTGNRTALFLKDARKVRTILSRPNFGFAHAWSRKGHPARLRGDEPVRAGEDLRVRPRPAEALARSGPVELRARAVDRLVAGRAAAAVHAHKRLTREGSGGPRRSRRAWRAAANDAP